jgi:aspartyl protease family protein
MLILSFALGLLALTFGFDGLLNNQTNPNRRPQSSETSTGVREVVLERNQQGHYVSSGQINDVTVTFLLDTGATDVAVPAAIAIDAGLERGFNSRAATANGVVSVYATSIGELRLGNIILHDVGASITPSIGGNTILLGMSALKRVDFTQRGSTLTLRQLPES